MEKLAIFFRLLVVIGLAGLGTAEITDDDEVLVLTEDNFQEALDTYNLLLVEFYAPWCGHCKKLGPEYWAAAKNLAYSKSPARLGKVDATVHKELATKYGVRGYPTLKFFKNGNIIDYTGGRTENTIVAWINKRVGDPVTTVDTLEAAEELMEKNKVVVFGFFKDLESQSVKDFGEVADKSEEIFAKTSNEELFKKYEVSGDSIVIFKKFDEGKVKYDGEMTVDSLHSWISTNSIPLIMEFGPSLSQSVFGQKDKDIFFIFASGEDEDYQSRLNGLKDIARENREKFIFLSVDTNPAHHKKVVEFFGVTPADLPTYRILKVDSEQLKYKPEKVDFSDSAISDFIAKYKADEVKPFLKVQDVPEDWDAKPVKVLTGINFDQFVYNTEKDVFVKFYAPWCGHCKKLAPVWEELATALKDDDSVEIAILDATVNDMVDFKIKSFPTLKLFKKGDNSVEDYSGPRELKDFLKYLRPEMVVDLEESKEEGKPAETEQKEKKDEL